MSEGFSSTTDDSGDAASRAPVQLHHRFDGVADSVVVLSNSLGTTLDMWDEQIPELSRRMRVLRYDHRGHGLSPTPPGPYSIDLLCGDVLALLDRLRLDRVSFCGLSLGGMVGMRLASRAQERIDKLVLACTSFRIGTADMWLERARVVRTQGTRAVVDGVLGRWFTPEFRAAEPATVERVGAMLHATPAEGYAACCDAIAGLDLREDLKRIRASTLVIAAADDPSSPREDARLIEQTVPRARLVVLPHAAHLANVERASDFTRAVLEHLTGEAANEGP